MKLRLLFSLTCLLALLVSGRAVHAGGARIVKGGPAGKAAKEKVIASFDRLRTRLAVCFCDGHPDSLRVELTVSARGKVLKAVKKNANAFAQCAAGVLAVNELAATGSRYKVVVELDPRAFRTGAGRGGGDVMARIKAELKPYRIKLQGCYDRVAAEDPDLAGAVELGFLIKPDGRIVDPEVKSSTLDHSGVEQCLLRTLGAVRLAKRPGGKTIAFSLALDFQGGGEQAPGIGGDPRLRPQKKGPVSASVLNEVMKASKPEFTACYDEEARRKPDLEGHVILRFTIRDNGTVRNVKIRESTLNDAKVERCIVKVGESLRFPGEKGREKTRVFYPFVFQRKSR